jgi:dihydrodipicolinate synthase/N-acetylneuraminate lyase
MNISKDDYKGVIVPMVTPFTMDGKIDEPSAEKLINFLLDNQTIPFVLGTTGETASIPVPEREVLIRILTKLKREGIPAIAGVIGLTFPETVSQANHYLKQGVDAVVITLPNYYELTEDQMYLYFKMLADKIGGDIIIYNIPKTVHQSIPLAVVDKLSHLVNIIGIKDSELNEKRLDDALALWSSRNDFSHFVGVNALMSNGLAQGSKGIVPSTANVDPRVYVDLVESCLEGDEKRIKDLYNQTLEWSKVYQKGKTLGDSLAALKLIMSEVDLCTPHVMPPLTELDENERGKVIRKFREMERP